MKIFKPKFWDQDYYTFFSLFLLPFSFFYQVLISLKKLITTKKKFSIPIICVGNIYIGGTGKTPLAIKIFKILKELNKNPVIIKKNFRYQLYVWEIYTLEELEKLHWQSKFLKF